MLKAAQFVYGTGSKIVVCEPLEGTELHSGGLQNTSIRIKYDTGLSVKIPVFHFLLNFIKLKVILL